MVHTVFCLNNNSVAQLLQRSNVIIVFVFHHFKPKCVSDLLYMKLASNGPGRGIKTAWASRSSTCAENLSRTSQQFSKSNQGYVTIMLTQHLVCVYLISRFCSSPSVGSSSATSVQGADAYASSFSCAFCTLSCFKWIDKPVNISTLSALFYLFIISRRLLLFHSS